MYHKAAGEKGKGVLSVKHREGEWKVTWADGTKDVHTEAELYTEEEYKEKNRKESPGGEGPGRGFISA